MTRTSAPGWALDLMAAVCEEAGVELPHLAWRRAFRATSSGLARLDAGRISVTAGRDELDARLTLLHELAHWLEHGRVLGAARTPRRRPRVAHHDQAFYAIAFPLYLRHGLEPGEALRREGAHYPSSLRHAARLGVAGAADALAARRELLRSRRRRMWRVLVPEHRVSLMRDGRWWVCVTCRHRIVGRALLRAQRRAGRERHVLWGSAEAAETA
jgi:hypothetical protein